MRRIARGRAASHPVPTNPGQDKTRQREVTDAGTTVPLSPHLQCRYSDDNIYFIQLKTLIDLRPGSSRLSLTYQVTGVYSMVLLGRLGLGLGLWLVLMLNCWAYILYIYIR